MYRVMGNKFSSVLKNYGQKNIFFDSGIFINKQNQMYNTHNLPRNFSRKFSKQ